MGWENFNIISCFQINLCKSTYIVVAMVSYGLEFEFWLKAFLYKIFMLCTYLHRVYLDASLSYYSNLYAWAINYLMGCITTVAEKKFSISVFPDVALSMSSPFLWVPINSSTKPFQLFTLNMHCMWLLFLWREVAFVSDTSHHKCNIACQRAWCLLVSDNSSWPLNKIVNLHCNYRIIDCSNKAKAFIGTKKLKVPPARAKVGLPNVGDWIGGNTEPRCCLSNCWPIFQCLHNKTKTLCAETFAKFHAWMHFYLSKI